jgi:hypothetical protein
MEQYLQFNDLSGVLAPTKGTVSGQILVETNERI